MSTRLLEDFGGVDTGIDSEYLHPSFSPDCRNVVEHDGYKGLIRPRRGSKSVVGTALTGEIRQMAQWVGKDGVRYSGVQYDDTTVDVIEVDTSPYPDDVLFLGNLAGYTWNWGSFFMAGSVADHFTADILAARTYYSNSIATNPWTDINSDFCNFCTDAAYTDFGTTGPNAGNGFGMTGGVLSAGGYINVTSTAPHFYDFFKVACEITLGLAYYDKKTLMHIPCVKIANGNTGTILDRLKRWRISSEIYEYFLYFQVSEDQPNNAAWNGSGYVHGPFGISPHSKLKFNRVYDVS